MTNSSAKLRSRRAISSSLRAAQKLSWLDGWASVWVAAGAEVDALPVGPRVGPEDEIEADVPDWSPETEVALGADVIVACVPDAPTLGTATDVDVDVGVARPLTVLEIGAGAGDPVDPPRAGWGDIDAEAGADTPTALVTGVGTEEDADTGAKGMGWLWLGAA